MEEERKKSAMSVTALVLGILTIVFQLFWYMCIPMGILSIVFGVKTTRKLGSKLGKAGMILGIVGLSLCVFLYISMIMLIVLTNAM